MAMLLARSSAGFRLIAQKLPVFSSSTIWANDKRSASSSKSFKAVPVEVKRPEEYDDVLPDPIEHATGIEKKQLLAQLQGDDRYESKVYFMQDGTKDKPNLVPSHLEERLVGCVCEQDQPHVNYMWVRKEEPKRCECGYWFKLVPAEEEFFP